MTPVEILSKVLSIILLDLVLSGDNAVVIALATRKLEHGERKKAILIGTGGAVILRIVIMLIAIQLLAIPFVKVIGAVLLFYIAYDLVSGGEDDENVKSGTTFLTAVRTIILADFVMSLDNVLAIAGVADGHPAFAMLGLAISIPIVVSFSQIIVKLMNRFPILVWIGGLMIAYTSGTMIIEDKYAEAFVDSIIPNISHTHIIPIAVCVLLIVINLIVKKISKKKQQPPKISGLRLARKRLAVF
jgi:YjbE family integral membrane protein